MYKIHGKKVILSVVFLAAFALAAAACGEAAHTHTFSEDWNSDDDNHWRVATCGDTDEVADMGAHEWTHWTAVAATCDTDGEELYTCSVCGATYTDPIPAGHRYSDWIYDNETPVHYKVPVCEHTDAPIIGPYEHVDEDGDNLCDECGWAIRHIHMFESAWEVTENVHWHVATCEHRQEFGSYGEHEFVDGVCTCGVTEAEKDVYALYAETGSFTFKEWRKDLAENGVVSVELNSSGDGVYVYEDGTETVALLGERTVRIRATASGQGLPHVWFKVSAYDTATQAYIDYNGTNVLGLAETDANGYAEIKFRPLGGYTTSALKYHVLAAENGEVNEDGSVRALPRKYTYSSTASAKRTVNITEGAENEIDAGTVTFKFSDEQEYYGTIDLPYRRYYRNPLDGENLTEDNKEYTFTAFGGGYTDYFYFETYTVPTAYALSSERWSSEQKNTIRQNSQEAAAGKYKISFKAADSTATITLRLLVDKTIEGEEWVSGGEYHMGQIYTGGDFIWVNISSDTATAVFNLTLVSDKATEVTLTVERESDYVAPVDPEWNLGVGEENQATYVRMKYSSMGSNPCKFNLQDVASGLYLLTITPTATVGAPTAMILTVKFDDGTVVGSMALKDRAWKGYVQVPQDAVQMIISNGTSEISECTVCLTPYNANPELTAETKTEIAGTFGTENPLKIKLAASVAPGKYTLKITAYGPISAAPTSPNFTVTVGDATFTGTGTSRSSMTRVPVNDIAEIELQIEIKEGDTEISISGGLVSSIYYAYVADVTLSPVAAE